MITEKEKEEKEEEKERREAVVYQVLPRREKSTFAVS